MDYLNSLYGDWEDDVSQDDMCSRARMEDYCKKKLDKARYEVLSKRIRQAEAMVHMKTAWRIEGTLREFTKFDPVNVWFDYPVHRLDGIGVLKDIQLDDERSSAYKRNFSRKKTPEQLKEDRKTALETAFEAQNMDGEVTLKDLMDFTGKSEDTIRRHIKEHGGFWIDNGKVGRKRPAKSK